MAAALSVGLTQLIIGQMRVTDRGLGLRYAETSVQ